MAKRAREAEISHEEGSARKWALCKRPRMCALAVEKKGREQKGELKFRSAIRESAGSSSLTRRRRSAICPQRA